MVVMKSPSQQRGAADESEFWYNFQVKSSSSTHHFNVAETDTMEDLKALLYSLTDIPPERQKILGLVKGKLPSDDTIIGDLELDPFKSHVLKLIGTPIGKEAKQQEVPVDILREAGTSSRTIHLKRTPSAIKRNNRKINERVQKLNINFIHPPRPGKNLLVLDLDYTLLDCKAFFTSNFNAAEFARPGLHQFLETVYPFYDISVWSATGWKYLESKCLELGMIGKAYSYAISFVLDKSFMFKVRGVNSEGVSTSREVKPLEVIFQKVPNYTWERTVHIDDIKNNFLLNPTSGIVCSPYNNSTVNKKTDRELYYLSRYLLQIASLPDLRRDHSDWKTYQGELPPDVEDPVMKYLKDDENKW